MTETGKAGAPSSPADASAPRHGLLELFLLFSQFGLSSFGGGVSVWVHRAFVERRRLIGETEFAAALALARIMPGANVVNLAIVIGQRQRGAAGAAVAGLGLLLGPSLAVIGLAILYRRFAGTTILQAAVAGAAAASVGLLIGMGVMLSSRILRAGTASGGRTAQSLGAMAVLAATFVLVGVLRLPMVPTVLCLAPLSIALAYFSPPRSRPSEKPDAGG
jgi:chromate transporter